MIVFIESHIQLLRMIYYTLGTKYLHLKLWNFHYVHRHSGLALRIKRSHSPFSNVQILSKIRSTRHEIVICHFKKLERQDAFPTCLHALVIYKKLKNGSWHFLQSLKDFNNLDNSTRVSKHQLLLFYFYLAQDPCTNTENETSIFFI